MSRPLVTIGVTLYNAEQHIEGTLESLVAQDWSPLEILVCDDVSRDASAEVAERFAAKHPIVKVVRNARNQGGVGNYNHVFHLARGEFFMWFSHDDRMAPGCVTRYMELLRKDPGLGAVFGRTRSLSPEGTPEEVHTDRLDTRGLSPVDRIRKIVLELRSGNLFYSLFRSSMLAQTSMLTRWWAHDFLILSELSLHGTIAQIDEVTVGRRRKAETWSETSARWLEILGLRGIERELPWLGFAVGLLELVKGAEPAAQDALLAGIFDAYSVRFGREIVDESRRVIELAQGGKVPAVWAFDLHRFATVALLALDFSAGVAALAEASGGGAASLAARSQGLAAAVMKFISRGHLATLKLASGVQMLKDRVAHR